MKKIITISYALLFALCISAQILVIPDIHGRTYWKEAVDKHPSLPVVFLGDYLDPYASENITPDEALANFKDIIAFKQTNRDRVTLLIGNHEIHYLDNFYKFSRKDTLHAEYIHQLLVDNLPLFSMASQAEMNGKAFIFTHAGIVESWWKKFFPDTPTDIVSVCNALNAKMSDMETFGAFIDDALMEVTKRRGGEAEAGSCLWADLDEHKKSKSFNGIYQVFGHTKQKKKAVIKKSFADLDCRKAFLITPSGEIIEEKKCP
ncbi:MAG: metallophosphoesterase [Prevotella sp.]|nr:metallophosphoesterase [Prevotella sp.]